MTKSKFRQHFHTQEPPKTYITPQNIYKLRSFPPLLKLVVGPLGECSGDLHELLNTLAESKMQYLSRSRGELESEWKTASHLTYLRRQISVCAVRGMAESLLTRLQQAGIGPGGGAAQAAKRRGQAMAREERGRRERAAHPWLPGFKSWPISEYVIL